MTMLYRRTTLLLLLLWPMAFNATGHLIVELYQQVNHPSPGLANLLQLVGTGTMVISDAGSDLFITPNNSTNYYSPDECEGNPLFIWNSGLFGNPFNTPRERFTDLPSAQVWVHTIILPPQFLGNDLFRVIPASPSQLLRQVRLTQVISGTSANTDSTITLQNLHLSPIAIPPGNVFQRLHFRFPGARH